MPKTDPRFDAYIKNAAPFAQPILTHVRRVVHAACPDAEETVKWGHPTFMYKGMLCGFAAFKAHCTLGFWRHQLLVERGVLPADSEAWGQFGRLTSVKDLPNDKALTKVVKAAMELNEKGIKPAKRPQPAKNRTIRTPPFLAGALKKNKKAAAAYEKFSYSHRKEYIEWLTEAKSDETRDRRLAQAIQWMAEGKPRNWKYM